MDYHRRRGRRRRGEPLTTLTVPNIPCTIQQSQSPRQWCFASGITSFLILSSLIGVIYLMLDYQCHSCGKKAGGANLATSVEQISRNLYMMQNKYYDLEMKITRLSQELPKLEGQINVLEALANTVVQKEMGWDPSSPISLANLDELLKKTVLNEGKNKSHLTCSKCVKKTMVTTTPVPVTINQD